MTPPEQLLLTFNTIVAQSCVSEELTLQNDGVMPTSNITFQTAMCSYDPTGGPTVLNVVIDSTEWEFVQATVDLATSRSNTYIALGVGFVADGGAVANSPATLQVQTFTPNTNPPVLVGGIVDLQGQFVGLLFSEGIDISSVDTTGVSLTFINITSRLVLTYTLTGGFAVPGDLGNQVGILLPFEDYNVIRQAVPISVNFTVQAGSFLDANGMANILQENVPIFQFADDSVPPSIDTFTLDLNTGLMNISFTEFVQTDAGDIDFSGIFLTGNDFFDDMRYNLSGSTLVSAMSQIQATTVTLRLSSDLLNTLNTDVSVCTTVDNCFMSWVNGSFSDLNGNPTVQLQFFISAFLLAVDETPPTLMSFSADLSDGYLNVTFSEPVDMNAFVISALILTNGLSQQAPVNGSRIGEDGAPPFSSDISITLSPNSLNFAKTLSPLRLAILANATVDIYGNQLTPLAITEALSPSSLTPDRIPPNLLGFAPSDPSTLPTPFLSLTFDEFVNTGRWNGNQLFITLQTSSGDTMYSSFTSGALSPAMSDRITYTFSSTEYIPQFSTDYTEAYNSGTILLSAGEGLIEDVSGNRLLPSSEPFTYSTQPPDTTQPTLSAFNLDMNMGTVRFTFSEPVSVSVVADQVQFINRADVVNVSQAFTLTENGTLSMGTRTLAVLDLVLSPVDLNSLKVNQQLCTSIANCFMFVLTNFAVDRSGNRIQVNTDGIQVSNYVQDTSAPSISSFQLDLDIGQLTLTFSEPIIQASFNFSQIFLTGTSLPQGGSDIAGSTVTGSVGSDTVFTIMLSVLALNRIKISSSLCVNTNTCFVYSLAGGYSDTTGNNVLASTTSSPVQTFFPDTTSPELLAYSLDLDGGLLSLTFSEPINSITFNPSGLTFVANGGVETFSLSDAFLSGTESTSSILRLSLGPEALNGLKRLSVAGSPTLALASSTASDFASNNITPIPTTDPLAPSMFTQDITPPVILSIVPGSPDEDDLTLVFSEVVNGSSLQEAQITILVSTILGTFMYSSFTGGSISPAISDRIVYTFSSSDFTTTFSSQLSQAIASGSVTLMVGSGFIVDLNRNPLLAPPAPLTFSTDSTRPTLVSFTLDLNMGLLDLSFSEAVNVIGIAGMARLQNAAANPTASISFTENGTAVPGSMASDSIVITLNEMDLNSIKINSMVGVTVANTYLVLEETFAQDPSGNQLIFNSSALQASEVVPDTSRPSLVSFDADMNRGSLTLEFSESVSVSSIQTSMIFLTGMIRSFPTGYNLSGSARPGAQFARMVTLILNVNLLNSVKADLQVCTSVSNCFIFVADGALTDVSGNRVIPSSTSNLVATFVADSTSPILSSYSLDLDSGAFSLVFSEPVLTTSFMPSEITFLDAARTSFVQAGDVSIFRTESDSTVLRLQVGSNLLNQLKNLASRSSIGLSTTSNSIRDTSSNALVAIPPTSSQAPSNFVPDTTPPTLLQFIPGSGGPEFTLVFDESVRSSTLTTNLLSFRLRNRNGQFDYSSLSSAIVRPEISDRITISFPPSETRFTDSSFLQEYILSYNEGSITLNLASAFINDLNGNSYSGPLSVVFTNSTDTDRPQLLSFALNLNTSVVTLTFSESVNVLSVAGNMRFQDSASSTPASVYNVMQNGTVSASQGGVMISITLSTSDLNNIISSPLATSTSNTYLLLLESFAVDNTGNFLNDTLPAVQASQVTQVIRGTMLLSFDLDLDSNIMTLQFDRGVRVSTFDSSQITLTNVSSPSISPRTDVRLNNVEVIAQPNSILTLLRFILRVNESIEVKRHPLCYDRSNCFGSFASGLIQDSTGNSTVPSILQVTNLFLDVTPPRLIAFPTFDLNRGFFSLVFSEPVNTSSVSFTDIQFANRITNPTANITLRGGITTRDHIEIDFSLLQLDLNAIKLIQGLCTSRENCWIRLPSFFINDIGMNPFLHSNFQPDVQASFHQPLVFVNDMTPPQLLYFSVDMNAGSMSLLFDEVIENFYPENITLVERPGGTEEIRLSRDTTFTRVATGDAINLQLTTADLNRIKVQNLYTSMNDSFLSLESNLLADTAGNVVTGISLLNPLPVGTFTPDVTSPTLIEFSLYNNDNGSIIVIFDEPVNIQTLNVTAISLLSGPSGASAFTLTGGTAAYLTSDQLRLLITMTSADLRAVKLITTLATSEANTYISITRETVLDQSLNPIVPITTGSPLQLSQGGFVSDSSRASLAGYTFDLNNGTITLTFTDVLNVMTLDPTQLSVQNRRASPSESVVLTGGSTPSENSETFSIFLSTQDLNSIQLNLNLATGDSDTFISFGSSLITDISGLGVNAVSSSDARGVATYIPDRVQPAVMSFSLDMNVGLISITFTEAVIVNTTSLTSLSFQNSETSPTSTYRLTDGMFEASGETTLSLQVNITYTDLNGLKSSALASSQQDTFLNIDANFITDTSSNLIQSGVNMAASYTRDSVPPSLLFYDLSLVGNAILVLQFSEAITYSSSILGTIALQNTRFNPSTSIILSAGSQNTILTGSSSDTVNITLSPTILVMLLMDPQFGSSTSNVYLSFSREGFRDFANNMIVPVPSNDAQRVQFICESLCIHVYIAFME